MTTDRSHKRGALTRRTDPQPSADLVKAPHRGRLAKPTGATGVAPRSTGGGVLDRLRPRDLVRRPPEPAVSDVPAAVPASRRWVGVVVGLLFAAILPALVWGITAAALAATAALNAGADMGRTHGTRWALKGAAFCCAAAAVSGLVRAGFTALLG